MAELSDPHIAAAVEAADATRKRLGLALDQPLSKDLLQLTEAELDIPVSILVLPEGVAGAYQRKRGQSFIFIQADHYPTRQRFTLAHEIGHHVLEHRGRVESENDLAGKTSDPNEQQANYFASELLVPLSAAQLWLATNVGTNRELDVKDLVIAADQFLVSPPAMLYRFSKGEFAGVTRDHLDSLWDEVKAKKHMEIAESLGIGAGDDELAHIYELGKWPRLPMRLVDNAMRAHAIGFIGEQRLGEVMRNP